MSVASTVYLKECRESLRDRRVLLNALLLGPLLGPLLFTMILRVTIGMELGRADKPLPVVVIGAERAPNLIEALKQQGLVPRAAVQDVEGAIRTQSIDLALRISETYATDWNAGRPARSRSFMTLQDAAMAVRSIDFGKCCATTNAARR
jgi:sodium transport system permease protein